MKSSLAKAHRLSRALPVLLAAALSILSCARETGERQVVPQAPAQGEAPAALRPEGAAAAPQPEGPESIRIGSYNMAMFGKSKAARPSTMEALARVGASFDLLAMQEVGSNSSAADDETCAAVMDAYLACVDRAAGGDYYDYVRGDQYAFLYRKDRLEAESAGLYEGKESFTYRPLVARFRVRGRALDFMAITIHTRPSLARSEVPALASAMDEIASSSGEPDVLCLGDFNADGSYYDEGPGSALEGFPPLRYATLIGNSADTTVAKASATYDRMETNAAMAGDYAGRSGVLRPGELWDLSACEGGAESAGTERALSDHYPVWAEFDTRLDRD